MGRMPKVICGEVFHGQAVMQISEYEISTKCVARYYYYYYLPYHISQKSLKQANWVRLSRHNTMLAEMELKLATMKREVVEVKIRAGTMQTNTEFIEMICRSQLKQARLASYQSFAAVERKFNMQLRLVK